MTEEGVKQEKFRISGVELKDKIKTLIQEGNVRRILIQNETGGTIVEIPVNLAIVGTMFAPVLAAVGALAALLTNCTVVVERRE